MRTPILTVLLSATATYAASFNAPAGCTGIQPSSQVTGVQCYGSGLNDVSFSGTGSNPLWATEVVFEWDFSVSRVWGSNAPVIVAVVNGEFFFRLYDVVHEPQVRYSGSASIPYTPGAPLTSWSVQVTETWGGVAGGVHLSAPATVGTPLDGVGFRFLANNQPPALTAVPEPGTAALSALALALLAAYRLRARAAASRIAPGDPS